MKMCIHKQIFYRTSQQLIYSRKHHETAQMPINMNIHKLINKKNRVETDHGMGTSHTQNYAEREKPEAILSYPSKVQTVWCQLRNILEQVKLICCNSTQNSGYLEGKWGGKGQNNSF